MPSELLVHVHPRVVSALSRVLDSASGMQRILVHTRRQLFLYMHLMHRASDDVSSLCRPIVLCLPGQPFLSVCTDGIIFPFRPRSFFSVGIVHFLRHNTLWLGELPVILT